MTNHPLFSLATRVYTDLIKASNEDVDALKERLRAYHVVDESVALLRLHPSIALTEASVCFGANTSGLPGADFYLTVTNTGQVLYSDGMSEVDVPCTRKRDYRA
jgi:hypothetical protein